MKKFFFCLFCFLSLVFASKTGQTTQKVAVVGGMWPLPPLVKIWTHAELIAMPKASLNSIQNSVVLDFFPELKQVRIGANDDENIEELLELNADLYICHKAKSILCDKLEKAGMNALNLGVNIDNYNSKKTLEYWLENLAKYFPIQEKNQKLIDAITQTEDFIAQKTKNSKKPKVLIIHRIDKKSITTGLFAKYLIEKSGGENFLEETSIGGKRISLNLEEIYRVNPEIIYISNFTSLMPDELLKSKDWQGLAAVKQKRVYKLPLATYRPFAPSLDLAPFLLFLAKHNHPEIFKDLDVKQIYKSHFKDFYGLDLNERQLEMIFNPPANAGLLQ